MAIINAYQPFSADSGITLAGVTLASLDTVDFHSWG